MFFKAAQTFLLSFSLLSFMLGTGNASFQTRSSKHQEDPEDLAPLLRLPNEILTLSLLQPVIRLQDLPNIRLTCRHFRDLVDYQLRLFEGGPGKRFIEHKLRASAEFLELFQDYLAYVPKPDRGVFLHQLSLDLEKNPTSNMDYVFGAQFKEHWQMCNNPPNPLGGILEDPIYKWIHQFALKSGRHILLPSAISYRISDQDVGSGLSVLIRLRSLLPCTATDPKPKFNIPALANLRELIVIGDYATSMTDDSFSDYSRKEHSAFKPIIWHSLTGYRSLADTHLKILWLESVNFSNTDLQHLQNLPLITLHLKWLPLDVNTLKKSDLPKSLNYLSLLGMPITNIDAIMNLADDPKCKVSLDTDDFKMPLDEALFMLAPYRKSLALSPKMNQALKDMDVDTPPPEEAESGVDESSDASCC